MKVEVHTEILSSLKHEKFVKFLLNYYKYLEVQ